MKHKGIVIITAAGLIGCSAVLGGCQWRPYGRDYFVSEGDGKAGSSYGEPWINSNAYGTVNKDTLPEGKNGDDSYLSANFDKIISTELTEGQKSVGIQDDAYAHVSACLLDMMKNKGEGADAVRVNALYRLYTDTESRKNAWTETIVPKIKSLQNTKDLSDLSAYLCSEDYFNNGESIVSFDYDIDYNDPDRYSFVVIPTQLSLGDAAEYSEKSDYGVKTEDIFRQQAKLLLNKAGYSDDGGNTIVENGLEFEKEIASYMNTQEFKYSSDYISSVNNPVDTSSLAVSQGNFPLTEMLAAYGIPEDCGIYMIEPKWLEGMKGLYTEDNFEKIKSYLLIKTLQGYADSADEETYTGVRDIYNKAYDIKNSESLEDYAYSYVKSLLPGELGRLYTSTQISGNDIKAAEDLLDRLKEKMKDQVDSLKFTGESVRSMSLEKLDKMKIHVACSDTDPNNTGAQIKTVSEGGTLADALTAIRKADREEKLSHLDKKVSEADPDVDMTDVSVKYYGLGNSLVVTSGALKGYFNAGMSEDEQLGGLGTLAAKELASSVLKTGSQYDADGKYAPYWSEADINAYGEHYRSLKEELDGIKPFKDDTKLDGARVLDSVVNEIVGYRAVNDLSVSGGDKTATAYARSRFALMREEVMESRGLNSTDALPYITVNMVLEHFEDK